LSIVLAEIITEYQGTQIISYPNYWLFELIIPRFGCVFF